MSRIQQLVYDDMEFELETKAEMLARLVRESKRFPPAPITPFVVTPTPDCSPEQIRADAEYAEIHGSPF